MAGEDMEYDTFDGDVISKNDYREELIGLYVSAGYDGLTKVTDFSEGSEALHEADVAATFLFDFRVQIDSCYRSSLIYMMEGEFLDNYGDMRGVHRYPSSPSTGEVTLTRLPNITGPINIESLQVATNDAISFILDDTLTEIPSDIDSVNVKVMCEQEGAYTNVEPGTITLVMGDLGNMITVTNTIKDENNFSDGADIEADDDYRHRIILSAGNVPTGTEAWHKNVALTVPEVHDCIVETSNNPLYDLDICFKPVDWNDMYDVSTTKAEHELRGLFALPEYRIPGIEINYILATKVTVLPSNATAKYLFAVLTKSGYDLADLRQPIKEKVDEFNQDAEVSTEFNPGGLASIIENEIEGVASCKIVKYEDGSYTELVEPENMQVHEVFEVDTTYLTATDSNARIVPLSFNLDLTLEGD